MNQTPPHILLHPDDNVVVLRRGIEAGETLTFDGAHVTAQATIAIGHKLARRALAAGDPVVKYGARIGSMTEAAATGAHVHMHNMKSDYIDAHTRQAAGPEAKA